MCAGALAAIRVTAATGSRRRDLQPRRIDRREESDRWPWLDHIAGIVQSLGDDAVQKSPARRSGPRARSRRRWRSAPAPVRRWLPAVHARRPPLPCARRRRARTIPQRVWPPLSRSRRAPAPARWRRVPDAAPAVRDGMSKRTSRSPGLDTVPFRLRQFNDSRCFRRRHDQLSAGRRGHDAGGGDDFANRTAAGRFDLDDHGCLRLCLLGRIVVARGNEDRSPRSPHNRAIDHRIGPPSARSRSASAD